MQIMVNCLLIILPMLFAYAAVVLSIPNPMSPFENVDEESLAELRNSMPSSVDILSKNLHTNSLPTRSAMETGQSKLNPILCQLILRNDFLIYHAGTTGKSFLVPCYKNRLRRQLSPVQSGVRAGIESANVLINAESSNVTVSQLINITSGRSIVDVRHDPVRIRVISEHSNVRIDPRDYYVNISVQTPYIAANVSDRVSLESVSAYSDVYVNTQPSNTQIPNVLISSGPSNLTVRTSGGASIEAWAERGMQAAIRVGPQSNVIRDEIVIDSRILDQVNYDREISLTAFTTDARMDLQLLQARLWIKYGSVELQISARNHEISIYTGIYVIRVNTLLSSFRVRITSTIGVEIDNATLNVYPENSNMTASIPNSLLLIRPDNGTTIQFVANDQQSAWQNSAIDLESRDLTLQILPSSKRIWAESVLSNALITSRYTTVGLRSNRSYIEILAGTPYMRAWTGNTSVQFQYGTQHLTLPGGSSLGSGALIGPPPAYQTVDPPFVFTVGPGGIVPIPPITPPPFPMQSTGFVTGDTSIPLPTPPPFPGVTETTSVISTQSTPLITTSVIRETSSVSSTSSPFSITGSGTTTVHSTVPSSIFTFTAQTSIANENITLQANDQLTTTLSSSTPISENASTTTIAQFSTLIVQSGESTSQGTLNSSVHIETTTLFSTEKTPIFNLSITPFSINESRITTISGNESNSTPISTLNTAFSNETSSVNSGTTIFSTTQQSISQSTTITGLASMGETSVQSIPFTPVTIPPIIPNETFVFTSLEVTLVTTSNTTGQETSTTVSGHETTTMVSGQGTTTMVTGPETSTTVTGQGTTTTVTGQQTTTTASGQQTTTTVSGQETSTTASGQGTSTVQTSTNASPIASETSSMASITHTDITQSISTSITGVINSNETSSFGTTTMATLVSGQETTQAFVAAPLIEIDSEIVTIQIPPMNMSTAFSELGGASSRFVIAQFSVISTSPQSPISPLIGSSSEQLIMLNSSSLDSPVAKDYLLSVGVKVKRSSDSYNNEFVRTIRNGLTQAYLDGKDRQLGVQEHRDPGQPLIRRRRLLAMDSDKNLTIENVDALSSAQPAVPGYYQAKKQADIDIKLTSIDRRTPDEAKIRFYLLNDNRLIGAKKAKETYEHLSVSELSSFLTYPVLEPIQPYSDDEGNTDNASIEESRVIIIILVAVGAAFLLILILSLVLCHRLKKKRAHEEFLKQKISSNHGQNPVHDQRGVRSPESRNVTPSPKISLEAKSLDETIPKKAHLADLPALKTDRLIRELSADDTDDRDSYSYTELFDYVQTPLAVPNAHINRIRPLPAPVPVDATMPPANAVMPDMTNWKRVPNQQQIVTLSPTDRRRLARQLLDDAFPLANVNIEDILQNSTRHTAHDYSVPGESLPIFESHIFKKV